MSADFYDSKKYLIVNVKFFGIIISSGAFQRESSNIDASLALTPNFAPFLDFNNFISSFKKHSCKKMCFIA